jgi:hypothetical protein
MAVKVVDATEKAGDTSAAMLDAIQCHLGSLKPVHLLICLLHWGGVFGLDILINILAIK